MKPSLNARIVSLEEFGVLRKMIISKNLVFCPLEHIEDGVFRRGMESSMIVHDVLRYDSEIIIQGDSVKLGLFSYAAAWGILSLPPTEPGYYCRSSCLIVSCGGHAVSELIPLLRLVPEELCAA
jgi:hypothetical protein